MSDRIRTVWMTLLSAGLFHAPAVWACSVCYGIEPTPTARAVNGAILFLLGLTLLVFAMFGAFAFSLWRIAKNASDHPDVPSC